MSTPSGDGVRPVVALAAGLASFVALVIAGFGVTSLFLEIDVIAVSGLGPIPGALAFTFGAIAFAAVVWPPLRAPHPSYVAVVGVSAAVFLAYLLGLWLGSLVGGAGLGLATAAVGSFATSVFAAVLLGSAAVCAWATIALVRTRAGRPRWPWEDEDD